MTSLLATAPTLVMDILGDSAMDISAGMVRRGINDVSNGIKKFIRNPSKVVKVLSRGLKIGKKLRRRMNSKFDRLSPEMAQEVVDSGKYTGKALRALGKTIPRRLPRFLSSKGDAADRLKEFERMIGQSSASITDLAMSSSSLGVLADKMGISVDDIVNPTILSGINTTLARESEVHLRKLTNAVTNGGLTDLIDTVDSTGDISVDLYGIESTTDLSVASSPAFSRQHIKQIKAACAQLSRLLSSLVGTPGLKAQSPFVVSCPAVAWMTNSTGWHKGVNSTVFATRALNGIYWRAATLVSVYSGGNVSGTNRNDLPDDDPNGQCPLRKWGNTYQASPILNDTNINYSWAPALGPPDGYTIVDYGGLKDPNSTAYRGRLTQLPATFAAQFSGASWSGIGTSYSGGDFNGNNTILFNAQSAGDNDFVNPSELATKFMFQRRNITTCATDISLSFTAEYSTLATMSPPFRIEVVTGWMISGEAFFPPQVPTSYTMSTGTSGYGNFIAYASLNVVVDHDAYWIPCCLVCFVPLFAITAVTITPAVTFTTTASQLVPAGVVATASYFDSATRVWRAASPGESTVSVLAKAVRAGAGSYPYGTIYTYLSHLGNEYPSGFYLLAHMIFERYGFYHPTLRPMWGGATIDGSRPPLVDTTIISTITRDNAPEYVWRFVTKFYGGAPVISEPDMITMLNSLQDPHYAEGYFSELLSYLKGRSINTFPLAGPVSHANEPVVSY